MYQRMPDVPIQHLETPRRWDAAPDLERFLASFYQYFEARGYRGIVAVHLSHLAALAFTISFSFTLLFFVNWQGILSCDSEDSCRATPLFYDHPFRAISPSRLFVLFCFFLSSMYWLLNVVAAYHNIRDASEMSTYFKESLGIVSDDTLATMLWSEVVSRLVQQQKVSRFCIVQDELTALEVTNIIMREDNFIIALTNHSAFISHLPPWMPPRLAYTRAVMWCLRTAIFRWAFDRRSRLRREFLDGPAALERRLRWMGVLNLLLMFPVLAFTTIYFFMRHAEEFRSHRSSPFQRQWTDYAKWTFREFNELPHQFSARMCSAEAMAEAYVNATRPSSPVLESLRRFAKFVAGAILAVLLALALWDETPLLLLKIQDRNLLWYLAFFGFLFTVADNSAAEGGPGQAPGPPWAAGGSASAAHTPSTPLQMYVTMMRLVQCTHFLPPSWRARASFEELAGACSGVRRAWLCQHFRQIRREILANFFVQRIQALAEELLGVILCPVLLIKYFPEASSDIVESIRRSVYSSSNLGDWCVFGCLDPARNGSAFYGGASHSLRSAGSSSSTGYPPALGAGGGIHSNGGKLEKSVISFILAHRLPWCGDDRSWQSMMASDAGASRALRPGRAAGPRGASGESGHGPPWGLPSAGAEEVSIPLREMGPSAAQGEAPPAPSDEAPVDVPKAQAPDLADDATTIWGYPPSAVQLLRDLEDFQRRELQPQSQVCAMYALLPKDLLLFESASSPSYARSLKLGAQGAAAVAADLPAFAAPSDSEAAYPAAHFFWLEALYDFHSGRYTTRRDGLLGTVACGEEASFELLEQEQP